MTPGKALTRARSPTTTERFFPVSLCQFCFLLILRRRGQPTTHQPRRHTAARARRIRPRAAPFLRSFPPRRSAQQVGLVGLGSPSRAFLLPAHITTRRLKLVRFPAHDPILPATSNSARLSEGNQQLKQSGEGALSFINNPRDLLKHARFVERLAPFRFRIAVGHHPRAHAVVQRAGFNLVKA